MSLADIVQRGWDAVGTGDFDTLVADYVEDMRFIMPSQTDLLEGRQRFRTALNGRGEILPPGFKITGLRQIEGENEVASIVEWRSEKVASSQLSVLFKFKGDKIYLKACAHLKFSMMPSSPTLKIRLFALPGFKILPSPVNAYAPTIAAGNRLCRYRRRCWVCLRLLHSYFSNHFQLTWICGHRLFSDALI